MVEKEKDRKGKKKRGNCEGKVKEGCKRIFTMLDGERVQRSREMIAIAALKHVCCVAPTT